MRLCEVKEIKIIPYNVTVEWKINELLKLLHVGKEGNEKEGIGTCIVSPLEDRRERGFMHVDFQLTQ